ncbi:MAG: sulfurtransferase TusA family protein [Gammaproteobacteria bacterium]|nr:sulfurtransferase TusA family protein [Gammaproteobacteria bacterium]
MSEGNDYKFDNEQDLSGLDCPLPTLRIKAALARMVAGEVLKVTATHPDSSKEIHTFCKQTGHPMIHSSEPIGQYLFWIEKKEPV